MAATHFMPSYLVAARCCLGSQPALAQVDLHVYQAGYRYHPWRVVDAVLPITARQALVAPQAPDAVFHDDPPLGEGAVVGDIFCWTLLATRFLARGCAQAAWVGILDPDVR